jgi:hypothetical protein
MAIRIKKSHEGKLHRALGVPANQTIPLGKIERAAHSKSPSLRKEAQFALNARKWNKK